MRAGTAQVSVLMIEDYITEKTANPKSIANYAPVSFGSKLFSASQLKMSIYAKEFLAVYYAFDCFAHLLWGITEKPIIVLTDNKSLTRFFQAKTLPAPMLNCIDRILAFKWVIGHIQGKVNLAADYISRANLDPAEKLKLKIGERIKAHDILIEVEPKCPDKTLDELAGVNMTTCNEGNQENLVLDTKVLGTLNQTVRNDDLEDSFLTHLEIGEIMEVNISRYKKNQIR